jgi:endonuclease YncB( thermonuclease family)
MIRRLFLLAAVAAVALWAEDFTGKVVAITDGDTIKVMHNGAAERIRLWGIDCPESKQAFGTRATQFTGDLAFGQTVTVKVRDVDRYKRTLRPSIKGFRCRFGASTKTAWLVFAKLLLLQSRQIRFGH